MESIVLTRKPQLPRLEGMDTQMLGEAARPAQERCVTSLERNIASGKKCTRWSRPDLLTVRDWVL